MGYPIYLFVKRGFLRHINYRTALILGVINFLVGAVSFFYLSRLFQSGTRGLLSQYNDDLAGFLVIGTTFNTFVGVALRAFALQVQNDQMGGTLEHLVMGRIGLARIAVYSSLYEFAWPTTLALSSLVVAHVLFGVELHPNVAAAVVFLLSAAGFLGLGLLSAGVVIVTKQGDPIAVAWGVLTTLLSGAFYPPEVLPGWLQGAAYIFPATYSLHGLRLALLKGYGLQEISLDVATTAGFAVVSLAIGAAAIRMGFAKASREGTLSHY